MAQPQPAKPAMPASQKPVPQDESVPQQKFPEAFDHREEARIATLSARSGKDLAGVRSLKIDLGQTPHDADYVLIFRSLGAGPELAVTVVNRSRLESLAWGLALAIVLIGVAMTRRSVRTKVAFIFVVALAATLVPLLSESVELGDLCNAAFYAVSLLAPYYLVAGMVRWLWGPCCRACARCTGKVAVAPAAPTASAVIMLAVVFTAPWAHADPPVAPPPAAGPYVVQIVEPTPPVAVPDDAVILPYDPGSMTGIQGVDKLLVPYDKYVELWNRAHPDKKIETKAAPAPYAWAGATYQTSLDNDESLLLTGRIEIDVFVAGGVQIPLRLGGGVLTEAQLDGKPARLSAAAAREPQQVKQSAALATDDPFAPPQPKNPGILVLHLSDKGHHALQLAIRIKLSRQGGWRVAEGVLPSAPAAALDDRRPQAANRAPSGRAVRSSQL